MKLIAQGEEAKLYQDGKTLIKERVKKGYRIPEIDEKLRASRTRLEAGLLREARRVGVETPQIVDVENFKIKMEFVDGEKVKDLLNRKISDSQIKEIGEKIGKSIALLHEYNIIHGDLTTSNLLLKNDKIYFIDFGLGYQSNRIEDKATDLYLLYHAIESTHWKILDKLWKIILNTYKKQYGQIDAHSASGNVANKIINTLSAIEKRGRYKER